MEGNELLNRLYRPRFQNSRTQASDLKGLSKCVGQSKNKDSYEDILLRDFLDIKRYGKDSFVFFCLFVLAVLRGLQDLRFLTWD